MTFIAADEIACAKQDIGYHEGRNSWNPYSLWQGLNPNNPWCASFACFAAYEGGGFRFPQYCTFGAKGEAYTPTMRTNAERAGYWRDKNWRAQPGDFVEYDWGHNGVIDHVEIVLIDDGVHLLTIGGNVSNSVAYRTRDRKYVAGFVALSESDQAEPPWKVQPMFEPALQVRAVLPNGGDGTWLGLQDGHVLYVRKDRQKVMGGMTSDADRKAWGNRTLANLQSRTKNDGKPGYEIVATDGNTYVPEQAR